MYLTVCPPCGPGSISGRGGIFRGISLLAGCTLPTRPEPAWQKMAQSPLNDTMQPVDTAEEERSPTMAEVKKIPISSEFSTDDV